MHDFRKAPKACTGKVCIRYIKTCTDQPQDIRCEYRMAWPGLIADGGIAITAQNRDALAQAEHEIQKVIYPGETKIPLSDMTIVLDGNALKDCPGSMTTARCNPA